MPNAKGPGPHCRVDGRFSSVVHAHDYADKCRADLARRVYASRYAPLAAAVSNAGAIGVITALTQPNAEALRSEPLLLVLATMLLP